MVDSFRSLGVEAVAGVGHPFDPNFHEAIMQEENDDVPDGTILQEFRKGFKCGDKLLRAAMVKVHLQLVTAFCGQQPGCKLGSQYNFTNCTIWNGTEAEAETTWVAAFQVDPVCCNALLQAGVRSLLCYFRSKTGLISFSCFFGDNQPCTHI